MKFRIPAEHYGDLSKIRDLGPETLQKIVMHLEAHRELPLSLTALRRIFTEQTGADSDSANALARQLIALTHLSRQRDIKVDDILSGLAEGFSKKWSPAECEAWRVIESPIRILLNSSAIRAVSKANALAYDYANLFQGARIVTDLRPIFNDAEDDGMDIDGAVVSYTLRLHFDNRSGDQSLSIALDEADILLLKTQCERALKKAAFMRDCMNRTGQFPTVISGEKANDDA